MPRRAISLLFALLLLGMQQAAQWHALSHLGESLNRPSQESVAAKQNSGDCVLCDLFAGGSGGPPFVAVERLGPAADEAVLLPAQVPFAQASPAFYLSRAPPALS